MHVFYYYIHIRFGQTCLSVEFIFSILILFFICYRINFKNCAHDTKVLTRELAVKITVTILLVKTGLNCAN